MSIVRTASPARNFTIVSNDVINDSRLSLEARGLLLWLLSKPENWQTNSDLLAAQHDVGRDRIRRVLRQLAEVGYMKLETLRDESGRITKRWMIYDIPKTGDPVTGEPAPENPGPGNSGRISKTDLARTDKQPAKNEKAEDRAPGGDSEQYEPSFIEFWKNWPTNKRKGSKPQCGAFWKRKKLAAKKDQIIGHVNTMKCSHDWTKENGQFMPAPLTYLHQMRWEGAEQDDAQPQDKWVGAI